MKKILIITSSVDYTADYIINNFNNKYNFYRINVDMFNTYEFNFSYEDGFSIQNNHWSINENNIDAIYYRKPILPDISEFEEIYHSMISRDIISYINGFVDGFNKKVLTKPNILRKTENKLYQIKIAKEIGFNFPKTSIGTSVNNINKLIKKIAIIKPLTTGKIIDHKNNLCEIVQTCIINDGIQDNISLTPLYIQEYINKFYEVRITIIERCVFAVKILANNPIDWRINQDKNKYSLITIPKEIEKKCFSMMEKMNLQFGAFDFIVDNNNNFIFLEINPNGQWLWLEENLSLNISNEILKFLTN